MCHVKIVFQIVRLLKYNYLLKRIFLQFDELEQNIQDLVTSKSLNHMISIFRLLLSHL